MPPSARSYRILVVDDDAQSRFVLRAHLKRGGHNIDLATSMRDALETVEREGIAAFDAVISDYWMPGGTGLDLLKNLQMLDPTLSVVLITAEGEKSIVAEILRNGGAAYLDKPVRSAMLQTAVADAAQRTASNRELRDTASAASALGRSQQRLLRHHVSRLDDHIELFFDASSEASGDFVSVLPIDSHRNLILASDSSGHDLAAAFHSNYFHGVARGMMERGAEMEEVFNTFNDLLLTEWNKDNRVTVSLAACGLCIDSEKGTLQALNCGFPFPLIASQDGFARPHCPQTGAAPLGWFDDMPTGHSLPLPSGYLCVWSDGLSDLADILEVDPLCLLHRLLQPSSSAEYHLSKAADDIAALRVNCASLGPDVSVQPRIPLIAHRIPGTEWEKIDELQTWTERSLRLALNTQLSDDKLADITVCLREALLNALKHGCDGHPEKFAELQVAYDSQNHSLHLQITDSGDGHDFDLEGHEPAAAANLLTEHRGLMMMKHLPSRTTAFSQGACVAMDFDLES